MNANNPAFPCNEFDFDRMKNGHFGQEYNQYTRTHGLSKREYFAASALQSLISNNVYNVPIKDLVSESIKYADEILEQLEAGNGL